MKLKIVKIENFYLMQASLLKNLMTSYSWDHILDMTTLAYLVDTTGPIIRFIRFKLVISEYMLLRFCLI